MQPRSDPLFGVVGDCDVSCWQGIEPGVTAFEDALIRLNAVYGYFPIKDGCFAPPSPYCARYTWRSETLPQVTEMIVNHKTIEAIIVYPPGFSVGEALLSLSHFRAGFVGTSDPSTANGHFYFQALFDETRLSLLIAPDCTGSYFAMMQSPVRSISVNVPLPPVEQRDLARSFGEVRERWYRLCER